MTERVRQILSCYESENPGVRANLARMLNHGTLAGTGRMVILPVDQGFEHGPARSFGPNPPGYDPHYHYRLAIEAGCNAYAAPLGSLRAGAATFAGEVPLILKLNNHEVLHDEKNPRSVQTSSIHEALRLGCGAIGYTIYPGSAENGVMYEQVRGLIEQAHEHGLAAVVWSYPRGENLSKAGETGIDVCAYAAQIACQLGADIVKVKLPTDHVEQAEARKVYEGEKIPIGTLTERVAHVVQSSFAGRRIVIFSGGAKTSDEKLLEEAKAIRDGGGFGSIMGRNAFQRKRADALGLLARIMEIYR